MEKMTKGEVRGVLTLAALLLAVAAALFGSRSCASPAPVVNDSLRETSVQADSAVAAAVFEQKEDKGNDRRRKSRVVRQRPADRPSPREQGQEVPHQ